MLGDTEMLLGFAVGGAGVLGLVRWWWLRRDLTPKVCDVSRCIVVVGNNQNEQTCVDQRVALKPHLMMIRDAGINVIEIYGRSVPRRNGKEVEWTDNRHLRRTLHAEDGFHLMCIDDDGEIAMRVRQPVSEYVIGELIAGSVHLALPTPKTTPPTATDARTDTTAEAVIEEVAEPESKPKSDGWSVSVLR